jgi:hypothetical protein
MERIREAARTGGFCTAVIPRESDPFEGLRETAPSPCRWPTLAITDLTMGDVDEALMADPLFHRCPDAHQGRVDVRYWYFHPLNLSCRHCSEGGGVCVVDAETVGCRHRMGRRTGEPTLKR